VEIFALATYPSAKSFPNGAVKSPANQVLAKVGQLVGVFGDLEVTALNGGGHGWLVGWLSDGFPPDVPIVAHP